jgi:hypothetical protein
VGFTCRALGLGGEASGSLELHLMVGWILHREGVRFPMTDVVDLSTAESAYLTLLDARSMPRAAAAELVRALRTKTRHSGRQSNEVEIVQADAWHLIAAPLPGASIVHADYGRSACGPLQAGLFIRKIGRLLSN